MKYFSYKLVTLSDGSKIGPAGKLPPPPNSFTGYNDGSKYYGAANIDSLDIISEFDPVEMSQEQFERYISSPPDITARQFYMQAEKEGFLTKQEVSDALKLKAIPSSIQAVLDSISDPEQKFAAEMQIVAALSFQRNNPLSDMIGAAFGKSAFQIDEFFKDAANL